MITSLPAGCGTRPPGAATPGVSGAGRPGSGRRPGVPRGFSYCSPPPTSRCSTASPSGRAPRLLYPCWTWPRYGPGLLHSPRGAQVSLPSSGEAAGGLVQELAWDPSGLRVAVTFAATPHLLLLRALPGTTPCRLAPVGWLVGRWGSSPCFFWSTSSPTAPPTGPVSDPPAVVSSEEDWLQAARYSP